MKYQLKIEISEERIRIFSSEGQLLKEALPLVTFEKEKIVDIGQSLEQVKSEIPTKWEDRKNALYTKNPFLFECFDPELAATSINFLSYSAINSSLNPRKTFFKYWVAWNLKFPRYEKLEKNLQEFFEYYAQKSLFIRAKTLLINNKIIPIEKTRKANNLLRYGFTVTPLFILLLASSILRATMGESFSAPIQEENTLLSLAIFTIGSLLLFFTAIFLHVLLWKLLTRSFVSSDIAREMVINSKLGLPKPLMKMLWTNRN